MTRVRARAILAVCNVSRPIVAGRVCRKDCEVGRIVREPPQRLWVQFSPLDAAPEGIFRSQWLRIECW